MRQWRITDRDMFLDRVVTAKFPEEEIFEKIPE